MGDLFQQGLEAWLDHHPHFCAFFFAPLFISTIHLYRQLHTIRKVGKMRRWDWLFTQGPRTRQKRTKSHPGFAIGPDDKTPPA